MDIALVLEWIIKSAILLFALVTGFAYLTLYERKVLARIQVRVGPNRAGPKGFFQPVADAIKLIFKEELVPTKADKVVFILAPIITVVPALIVMGVVPWGDQVVIFGREVSLSIANINIGILYVTAITSISVYGIVLAGWSSNNKYAMLGGIRSTAQMISYELALGLGFVGPMLLAGSMNLKDIVETQQKIGWFVIWQPVGALIFWIATLAEVNRAPFDMPEAEQELTAGYHTEYSGMKFALFFMAEYIKMIAVSAIAATLFFGGYLGPGVSRFPWLGPLYLLLKVVILLFGMIWVRATLPRIRYDRLMAFGWKIMFPIALGNVFITAVGVDLADWEANVKYLMLAGISVVTILYFLLVVYLARNSIGKSGGKQYVD
jgi:NADH-quinone oxidoreductase subunit H